MTKVSVLTKKYLVPVAVDEPISMLERIVWTMAWFTLLFASIDSEISATHSIFLYYWVPIYVATSLVGMALAWRTPDDLYRYYTRFSMGCTLFFTFIYGQLAITTLGKYASDEGAFNQYAARLLLHGHNPYLASMTGAQSLFTTGFTDNMNFTEVFKYSYPAGSLWPQALIQALGFRHLATCELVLFAWVALGAVLFATLPRQARPIVPILLFTAACLSNNSYGLTDPLAMPFLTLAVWQWDRFSDSDRARWLRWLGPVSLGLACSIKQGPWFCVPFLFVGIALEAKHAGVDWRRELLMYASAVGGVFVAVNLPFMLASPAAWLRGVLLPLTSQLLPNGRGIVFYVIRGVIPSAHFTTLGYAGMAFYLICLLAFLFYPDQFKRVWVLFIPMYFFFPDRSYDNYFYDFIPIALVAASSVRGTTLTSFRAAFRWHRQVLTVATLLFASLFVTSFTNPTFTVHIINAVARLNNTDVTNINLEITNNTGDLQKVYTIMQAHGGMHNLLIAPSGNHYFFLTPHQTRIIELTVGGTGTYVDSNTRWLITAISPQDNSFSDSSVIVLK